MTITLFGNSKDYQILHEFIYRHWKEIYNKTGLDAYECLFYHEEWHTYQDRYNPIYNPDELELGYGEGYMELLAPISSILP